MIERDQLPKLRIGVSACLMGEEVRFDGGHKASQFCQKTLAPFVEYIKICPEISIGLGTPRKAIRLVNTKDSIELQASDGSFNITKKMQNYAETTTDKLDWLSGYIVCAKSPTCGMERVPLYSFDEHNQRWNMQREGRGMFTDILMKKYPFLPVEENGRLNDNHLRENFVNRIFTLHDLQHNVEMEPSKARLINFHSRYKYLIMSHSAQGYKDLGQITAHITNVAESLLQYKQQLMNVLSVPATRKKHVCVLQHLQGYFKKYLNSEQRQLLAKHIDDYRRELLPLLVPITLIKQYLAQYPDAYVAQQTYLDPHPETLKLRYEL